MAIGSTSQRHSVSFKGDQSSHATAVRDSRLSQFAPASPQQSSVFSTPFFTPSNSPSPSQSRHRPQHTKIPCLNGKEPPYSPQYTRTPSITSCGSLPPCTQPSDYGSVLDGIDELSKGPGADMSQAPANSLTVFSIPKSLFQMEESDAEWKFSFAPEQDVLVLVSRLVQESKMRHAAEEKLNALEESLTTAQQTRGRGQMERELQQDLVSGDQLCQRSESPETPLDEATRDDARVSNMVEEGSMSWEAKFMSVDEDYKRICKDNMNLFDYMGEAGKRESSLATKIAGLEKELETYRNIHEQYQETRSTCATTQAEDKVENASTWKSQPDLMVWRAETLGGPSSHDGSIDEPAQLQREVDQLRHTNSELKSDLEETQELLDKALQAADDTTTELHTEMEIDANSVPQPGSNREDQQVICTAPQEDLTAEKDVDPENLDNPELTPVESHGAAERALVLYVQPRQVLQEHFKVERIQREEPNHSENCRNRITKKRRHRSSSNHDRDQIANKRHRRKRRHQKHHNGHEHEDPSASRIVWCRSARQQSGLLGRWLPRFQYWAARIQRNQKRISRVY
ncbi:hypothetical protein FSARC_11536 [Fusarium sarcochroum]|uniref:Uncharacterized protein n=1 Tax=Fusarium sarcochroum TaxID=1208366 RepID=A0A8H4TEY7_9HYPO|nr:hypothetical protein FSARC_11536 [Fusarium sarcochroum]